MQLIPCCAVAFDIHRDLNECVILTASDQLSNTLILFDLTFKQIPVGQLQIKKLTLLRNISELMSISEAWTEQQTGPRSIDLQPMREAKCVVCD